MGQENKGSEEEQDLDLSLVFDPDNSHNLDKASLEAVDGSIGSSSTPPNNGGSSKASGPLALVPKWIVDTKKYLLEVQDGGDEWDTLITKWLLIEALLGYPDGQVSVSVIH